MLINLAVFGLYHGILSGYYNLELILASRVQRQQIVKFMCDFSSISKPMTKYITTIQGDASIY